ncbi:hypothetical protein ABH935_007736 [Catenulispora sp. GAS73]|uniref:hypothetical protein n=1 Tax=Catenulispora sp. GAS73 TaxID=3156269 RepID=UPI0035167623
MRITKSLGTTVAAIALGAGTVLGAGLVAGTQAGAAGQQHSVVRLADSGTPTTSPTTSPTSTNPTGGNDPWD